LPLGRVDGEDRIHLGKDFACVHFLHADGRDHEFDRLVRTGRRIRANVGRDDHVARKWVAFRLHAGDFQRNGDRGDRSVAVGDEADALGPRTEAAELADDAERTSGSAAQASLRACDDDLDEVGLALAAADFLDRYAGSRIARQEFHNRASRGARTVERFEGFQCLLETHGIDQSIGVIWRSATLS
jgi:hypothetical protein